MGCAAVSGFLGFCRLEWAVSECCEMGILAGGWGCVWSWVTALILSLPCLVLGRLKLVLVLSSFVPSPGHTQLPSTSGTSNARFWRRMSQGLCWLAGSRIPHWGWWATATWCSSTVPAPVGNTHGWHQIPGLLALELKAQWWGGRAHFSSYTRESWVPKRNPCHLEEKSDDVSCHKSWRCVFSRLAAFSLPEAWGCLINTLVPCVDCGISVSPLVWHVRLVD